MTYTACLNRQQFWLVRLCAVALWVASDLVSLPSLLLCFAMLDIITSTQICIFGLFIMLFSQPAATIAHSCHQRHCRLTLRICNGNGSPFKSLNWPRRQSQPVSCVVSRVPLQPRPPGVGRRYSRCRFVAGSSRSPPLLLAHILGLCG